MALDPLYETTISDLVAQQFPYFYREEGELFVEFVRQYYLWMESQGQVLYHARRIPQYKDVDSTVDAFVTHFTQKYLSGIQLGTNSNVRQLIKHSLDLYRTKGSPRSLDLLFRLVYGVGASTYYPSSDLLRASDGEWVIPTYLEVTSVSTANSLVGSQIVGVTSGARAFVERYVVKQTPNKYVNLLYLSGAVGQFSAGERVNRESNPLVLNQCPVVVGSLSSLSIVSGGGGYNVGDIVPLTSQNQGGVGGKGRVTSIVQATGAVSTTLVDGGYGYTTNAQVLISNTVLSLSGFSGGSGDYVNIFDQFVQQSASVSYSGFSGGAGTFSLGANVFVWSNNVVVGSAVVTSAADLGGGTGTMLLSVLTGNVSGGPFYTAGNTLSATQTAYSLTVATGNAIAVDTVSLALVSPTGSFSVGEQVSQSGGGLATVAVVNPTSVVVSNVRSRFVLSSPVTGVTSGATATLSSVSMRVGMTVSSGVFTSGTYSYLMQSNSTPLQVQTVGAGAGFSAQVAAIDQTEVVNINDDVLATYSSVPLNAASYGFPQLPSANQNTILINALHMVPYTIGRVSILRVTNPGTGYTAPPMIRIYEPVPYTYTKRGWEVDITGSTGIFANGEIITQAATGARGQMEFMAANGTHMTLKRMSFFNDLVVTGNSTTQIVGSSTGTTANVTFVVSRAPQMMKIYNTSIDAQVNTVSTTSNGVVVTMEVADSGLGYVDGEVVNFQGNTSGAGQASASVQTQGTGTGYYKRKGGFLSDTKKLFDGYYWQEFSYEVRSALDVSIYKDMLKKVVHVAGTKTFSSHVTDSRATAVVNVFSTQVNKILFAGGAASGSASVAETGTQGAVTGQANVSAVASGGVLQAAGQVSGPANVSVVASGGVLQATGQAAGYVWSQQGQATWLIFDLPVVGLTTLTAAGGTVVSGTVSGQSSVAGLRNTDLPSAIVMMGWYY